MRAWYELDFQHESGKASGTDIEFGYVLTSTELVLGMRGIPKQTFVPMFAAMLVDLNTGIVQVVGNGMGPLDLLRGERKVDQVKLMTMWDQVLAEALGINVRQSTVFVRL